MLPLCSSWELELCSLLFVCFQAGALKGDLCYVMGGVASSLCGSPLCVYLCHRDRFTGIYSTSVNGASVGGYWWAGKSHESHRRLGTHPHSCAPSAACEISDFRGRCICGPTWWRVSAFRQGCWRAELALTKAWELFRITQPSLVHCVHFYAWKILPSYI